MVWFEVDLCYCWVFDEVVFIECMIDECVEDLCWLCVIELVVVLFFLWLCCGLVFGVMVVVVVLVVGVLIFWFWVDMVYVMGSGEICEFVFGEGIVVEFVFLICFVVKGGNFVVFEFV